MQYDCAGGLCLIQDGLHLILLSQPEPATSLNATAQAQFKVVTIKLRSLTGSVNMELCVSKFPWEKPKKEIREKKIKGYPKVLVPSSAEIDNMPKILLGVRALRFLPVALQEDLVPTAFRKKWPGLKVFTSKLTGKLLFAGMLPRRDGPYSIPMLAFTAKDQTDEGALKDEETADAFWLPAKSPVSLTEDSQPFLLSLISWYHII